MSIFDRIILTLFRRAMNRYVNRVLSVAYETGHMKRDASHVLHLLSSYFDSTQTRLFLERRSDMIHRHMDNGRTPGVDWRVR